MRNTRSSLCVREELREILVLNVQVGGVVNTNYVKEDCFIYVKHINSKLMYI